MNQNEKWEAHGNGIFEVGKSTNIATVTPCGDRNITESRAHLMAASKDLLEALEEAVLHVDSLFSAELKQKCEAAISKAKGE